MEVKAYAARSATDKLVPLNIPRRVLGADDVLVDIEYCGVCHSDIHAARSEWPNTVYPIVPGHEIVGRVAETGSNVKSFTKGELVGVGVIVDSCQKCTPCSKHQEQYCVEWPMFTYNSPEPQTGTVTYGGYSEKIVTNQKFVLKVSEALNTKAVAPLLCAGITTYSPLRHWQAGPGKRVGIVGLGGLGHLAVKFAVAMGAQVAVITASEAKRNDALKMGAHKVVVSSREQDMTNHANGFDLLINTIPTNHDVSPYVNLLDVDGTMIVVGAVEPISGVDGGQLLSRRRSIAGSMIGGMAETQEMLDFCASNNILPEVEMTSMHDINNAFDRVVKADVRYRFVIDMQSLKS